MTFALGVAVVVVLIVFVVLPIWEVMTYPDLSDYLSLPENGRWLRAASNTAWMVVLSTSSATLLGFTLLRYSLHSASWGKNRHRRQCRSQHQSQNSPRGGLLSPSPLPQQ